MWVKNRLVVNFYGVVNLMVMKVMGWQFGE